MILFSNFSKFAREAKNLLPYLRNRGAELLIAVFDNDGAPHDERIRKIKEGLKREPSVEMITAVGIAVQKMEAWLLADAVTLSKILSTSVKEPPTPETIDDPKEYLDQIFASSPFIVKDTALFSGIAERISKAKLLKKCRSFKRFHDEISKIIKRIKATEGSGRN